MACMDVYRYNCRVVLYYAVGILLFGIDIDGLTRAELVATALNLIANSRGNFKRISHKHNGIMVPFAFIHTSMRIENKKKETIYILLYTLYVNNILFVVAASKLGDVDLVREAVEKVFRTVLSECTECQLYRGVLVDITCNNSILRYEEPGGDMCGGLHELVLAHTVNGIKEFYRDPTIHVFEHMNLWVIDAVKGKRIVSFIQSARLGRTEHIRLLVLSGDGARRAMEVAYKVLRAINKGAIVGYGENSRAVVA